MASTSLSPYKNSSTTETFSLVSATENGATYKVSGRALSVPYTIDVRRKFTAAGAAGNDHVTVRVARVEANAETGKLATCQVMLDISIPKDTTVLTTTIQKEIISVLASLLNESTAMEATNANITSLIEGYDI
jgi:hypothetical protein